MGSPNIGFSIWFSVFDAIQKTKDTVIFSRWFYTGADGAEHHKTKTMAKRTRWFCRAFMMGFVGMSIGVFLPLGVALILLLKNGMA